jgi:hypothetical protein
MSTLKTINIIHPSGTVNNIVNDSNGNVGIGTSSPLSVTNYKFLTVQAGTSGGGYALYNSSGTEVSRLGTDNAQIAFYNWTSTLPTTFLTNSTERMRIDSSGNLLVGTTSADARFQTQSAGTTSATRAFRAINSASTELCAILSSGDFYTGVAASSPYNATTASAANIFVTATGQLQRSTSSLRYKENIQDATHGLAEVMQLRSVTYNGKKDGDKIFGGFIAEEVHTVGLSEFVVYDGDGKPDALHYGNMIALMAKAIQELSAKNDALEARLAKLENVQ